MCDSLFNLRFHRHSAELSAAADEGVRRAAGRLAAGRVVDYNPPSVTSCSGGSGSSGGAAPSVHAYELWRGHVAIFCAAVRPRGHTGAGPSPSPSRRSSQAPPSSI